MLTSQTVLTIIGGLAGLDTTMWVKDFVIVLLSKPIIQIVKCLIPTFIFIETISTITVDTFVPILVTGAPECFVSLQELFVELPAGGVDGEHLV